MPWLIGGTLACGGGGAARQANIPSAGVDEISGVLNVTTQGAYLEHDGRRVSLIEAPPQTALSHTTLMEETAMDLKTLDGSWVRARGNRQGSILWDVVVTPTRRNR